ncbi:hypothetical protein [Streptomyces sp. NPDC002564]|uniref:hypothetical protein n=1 Tax=Streptomyces sp. NPDC002564 TaxID=3364649 RepID=UPI00368B7149
MRRFGEVAAWISAITGLIGLVLGFFGLPAVFSSPTARTVTETVTATATVTAPADPAKAPPSPSSSAQGDPRASDVVRSVTVDLAADYGLSLEDTPLRPVNTSEANKELFWDSGNLRVGEGAQLVVLGRKEKGTYETCSSVTRFRESVFIEHMRIGERFCLLSPSGLVALAEYAGGDIPSAFVRLKFTVWNGRH